MPQILLVNPRKRTAKRKTSIRKNPVKKRRTAAQKAATRKLVALNRRRGGSARRKNPVKRTTRRKPTRRRAAPAARKRRRSTRRRSNPALSMRSVQNQVMEAGTGAVGAIALDVVQGYLPIPANWKAGIVGTLVKAGLAIGIGVIGSKTKLVSNATAGKMANGALTVVLHDELKKQITTFAPGLQMGEYLEADLGEYYAGFSPTENGDMNYLPEMGEGSFDIDTFDVDSFGMGEYIGANGEAGEQY